MTRLKDKSVLLLCAALLVAAGCATTPSDGGRARPNFPITGDTDVDMLPGGPSVGVDLALKNQHGTAMVVTNLAAVVLGNAVCGPANFAALAYNGPARLTVPAHSVRKLSELGVPRAQWPQIQLLNLPSNQDACKGAVVPLRFSGTGRRLS
ncbi:MAG: hypothetical protein JWQ74_1373 [Marmoricola sp.]|nr:hypothetical protein [Marmoricola sp.]